MNKLKYYFLQLNKFLFIKIIKYCFSILALLILKVKKKFLKKSKKKRRLFSTTGNISLINALTIIKQLEEQDCEDYLIIDSYKGSYKFWKTNIDIANFHNFKSIKCFFNNKFSTELRFANWTYFDEIFMLNHSACLPAIMKLYPDAKISLFDEGCGSLVVHNDLINNIKNFNAFYTHKYIEKIDGFNLPIEIMNKIKPLNLNIFQNIAKKIEINYPINIKLDKNAKYILFCGIYWQCSGLKEDLYVKEQQKQINELIQAGYKILYKPHPREINFYGMDKNPNIIFIDSVLPVELYNWNVLAVTGMSCSTLIHLPHYHNIPAFSNILYQHIDNGHDSIAAKIIRFFIGEYAPNYKELLKLDVKNTSNENLKKQIKKLYIDLIKDKPLLSKNEKVKEYAKKYGI